MRFIKLRYKELLTQALQSYFCAKFILCVYFCPLDQIKLHLRTLFLFLHYTLFLTSATMILDDFFLFFKDLLLIWSFQAFLWIFGPN